MNMRDREKAQWVHKNSGGLMSGRERERTWIQERSLFWSYTYSYYQHYTRHLSKGRKYNKLKRDVIAVSLLNNRIGQTVKKVIVSHTKYKECSNELRITHKGRDVNIVVRMECEIKIIVKHNPFIESIIPISMWHN